VDPLSFLGDWRGVEHFESVLAAVVGLRCEAGLVGETLFRMLVVGLARHEVDEALPVGLISLKLIDCFSNLRERELVSLLQLIVYHFHVVDVGKGVVLEQVLRQLSEELLQEAALGNSDRGFAEIVLGLGTTDDELSWQVSLEFKVLHLLTDIIFDSLERIVRLLTRLALVWELTWPACRVGEGALRQSVLFFNNAERILVVLEVGNHVVLILVITEDVDGLESGVIEILTFPEVASLEAFTEETGLDGEGIGAEVVVEF